MKQSVHTRRNPFSRELWVDAFKGPGLGAGFGATLGFILEFVLAQPGQNGGFGSTIGFSFFSLPGLGAAIGGGAGALWLQTRPSFNRLKTSHQEKESS